MISQNKTVFNHITLRLSDFWLSQRFSTNVVLSLDDDTVDMGCNVVLCLGDDTVDMGCNAFASENPA
jgi:hypothetical protein